MGKLAALSFEFRIPQLLVISLTMREGRSMSYYIGRLSYKSRYDRYMREVDKEIEREKDSWPLLAAGLFDGGLKKGLLPAMKSILGLEVYGFLTCALGYTPNRSTINRALKSSLGTSASLTFVH